MGVKMMRTDKHAFSHDHCPDCRGTGCVEVATLAAEIAWCEKNKGKGLMRPEFEDGFISGLKQATFFSDQPSSQQTSKNTEHEALVSALRATLIIAEGYKKLCEVDDFPTTAATIAIQKAYDALKLVSPKEKAIK